MYKHTSSCVVLDEGLYADVSRDDVAFYSERSLMQKTFPHGIPREVTSLNELQAKRLVQYGAAPTKLFLSELPVIYAATTVELALEGLNKSSKEFAVADAYKRLLDAGEAFRLLMLQERYPDAKATYELVFDRREKAAIECVIEAANKQNTTTPQRVILVYGNGHMGRFQKYCDELNIPLITIDTQDGVITYKDGWFKLLPHFLSCFKESAASFISQTPAAAAAASHSSPKPSATAAESPLTAPRVYPHPTEIESRLMQ